MGCYARDFFPNSTPPAGRPSYSTLAACLEACKEGACCEGTTCTVMAQCQCQGAGKVFKGVGTTCSPNPCGCCADGTSLSGAVSVAITRTLDLTAGSFCRCSQFDPAPPADVQCTVQQITFTQYGLSQQACSRIVSADTPDIGFRTGQLTLTTQCQMNLNIDWPLNPCGGIDPATNLAARPRYSWSYSSTQSSYSVTLYNFLFVDGYGGSTAVMSTLSSVPSAPAHPQASSGRSYVYGGARWTIAMGVTFA